MPPESMEERIELVRRFNRFFTRKIGVLHEGLLDSPFSLTEARVIFELAHREGPTAAELCRDLGLDAGYLSRLLGRLEQQGLVCRVRSERDGRERLMRLTESGREAFRMLDGRSREEVREWLGALAEPDRESLLASMGVIEKVLDPERGKRFSEPFVVRPPEPGDFGWIISRHGALYAREYHWDETFEGFVAEIVGAYIAHFNPARERCWMAEMDGEPVGSIVLAEKDEATAKLRLLIVEPRARGLGVGTRLVQECIRFARRVGYRTLMLWTNHILLEARHIYEKLGFRLTASEPHHSFGHDLIGETWERTIQ